MAVTLYFIYAIIAVASASLYFIKRRLDYWKDRGIAHDKPTLIFGNFRGLYRTRNFYDILKGAYEKYKGTGPFCGIHFFQKPGIVLLDLDLIKNVLIRDFSNFTDRGGYHNAKDDPLSGHLALVDGAQWQQLRTKWSPTFTSAKTKFMLPTIKIVAQTFVDFLSEATQRSEIVEIRELLACFLTDLVGSCAFGLECNSLRNPEEEFRQMGRRTFDEQPHPLIMGFTMGFPNFARFLGIRRFSNPINQFFINIVRETVEYREKNNIQRKDFMNILMDFNTKKNGEKRGLTIEEMAAQAFLFFLGGFESSSTTIAWTLYELSMNQNIQDKLRTEIFSTLNKNNNELTYEALMEMQYMGQIIHESLRKYPVFPHLNRLALNDYSVHGNPKYHIEKGLLVFIPVSGIHHDPEIYPNPEVFDPERFTPAEVAKRHPMAFLGFGEGPRNCIGSRFGEILSRITIAYLIMNFKLSPCQETEIPPIRDAGLFVTTPKNGMKLKINRI